MTVFANSMELICKVAHAFDDLSDSAAFVGGATDCSAFGIDWIPQRSEVKSDIPKW